MIKVEGLTKRYPRTVAVDDISFSVEKGQIVGFLGPNGAGKTTTMRVLTCFMPPTKGSATVAGFDVMEQPMEVKRRIGYLPESPPLYPEMEVIEYLNFVGRLKGISGGSLKQRVNEVCERVAIDDVRTKLVSKLSRGYRQRVGLAQAIIHNPDVLVLDEPTAGLDPKQINQTRKLIKERIQARFDTLLPELMRREGFDMWIVITREYNSDPVFRSMAPITTYSSRRRTILMFHDLGPGQGVDRTHVVRDRLTRLPSVRGCPLGFAESHVGGDQGL